jgi:SagB-type dehydrogenase family enzyme
VAWSAVTGFVVADSQICEGAVLPDPNSPFPVLPMRAQESASDPEGAADAITTALLYHQRSKHHFDRYARSLGYLDWATQPDPFRIFRGAERVELPLAADTLPASYADLYQPGAAPAQPLGRSTIAVLFELALGLSAWKKFQGNRWALRCNPSSGNLHPTEGYAVLPRLPGFEAGVYHYVSRDHALEKRCVLEEGAAELTRVLPEGSFLVGLSSVHWREAWKYGERAFRYCQHDAGHAIATVRYAAAALGWSARLLEFLADDDVAAALGLDRGADFAEVDPHDREHPVALILVSANGGKTFSSGSSESQIPLAAVESIRAGKWTGQANPLSPSHVRWEVIDAVAKATRKATTVCTGDWEPASLPPLSSSCTTPAAALIRQRRSCLALDGRTAISAATFYRMLDGLLPRRNVPPWDVLAWLPHLHAGIFVHRVSGLAPGLYLLERDGAVHDRLRAALRPSFLWERPADCPEHLRLFCLMRGDLRERARMVSCHQEIAADGAFSLGMIADFTRAIRAQGAWWYRRLFWEAGILGQVLYLEAEAAGVRSTGIGCYFDDAFHEMLGLAGDDFQDLYHFTVGCPVEDRRLLTLPPYAHLSVP